MPSLDYIAQKRAYGLTQKGRTECCPVCGGVGAVLAFPVEETNSQPWSRNADGSQGYLNPAHVVEDVSVLIPCPGCFSDAAILTLGL